ncbi:hypothetical protein [Nonomuraea typhae]|uniref:Secreted protein n=1 Tax=Nonomuraea typhae TaxID=2603600 RepID=A0ABW7Z973_9ACTN
MTSLTDRTSRRRVWAGAVSMTACLTVVLGGGLAGSATAAVAGAENAAGRLDEVDWASVVKPALNCPEPGRRAAWNVVRARVAAVGDLTHDGKRETVVVSSCPSPTASNPMIAFVYDGSAPPPAPRLLGRLGENRYFTSLKVTIRGGSAHLRGKALSDRAPRCCPDLIVSQSYRWDGTKLRRTADKARRIT